MTTPIVLALDDEGADLATVGGKGASLAVLTRAGLPVPPGFHVSTAAYRAFVDEHGLQDKIVAAAAGEDAEAVIGDMFAAHPIPDVLATPIRAAYAALGSPAVAVRSSATAEDLAGASFAGQQDTFLDITGESAVLDAIRRCWASLWTDRAISYRRREGIDPDAVALAVVVQELVDADAAGVLFTADPVSGGTTTMIVNATWGLGESLVSGHVTPDEVVLDAVTGAVLRRTTGDKAVRTVRTPAGPAEEEVPPELREAPVLDDAQARELAGLGRRIAAGYGRPMDVEWTLAAGTFAIVQARPITGIRDPWNDSRTGDYLWTNTNLGEAIPDVMTPCTWSLVQIFMEHAMATASLPAIRGFGVVGGRFYLNMSVTAAISASVGVNEKRFRALTSSTFGTLPAGMSIPPAPISRLRILAQVLPAAVRVLRRVRANTKILPAFVSENLARCDALRSRITATADTAALARIWAGELRPLLELASDMLEAAGRSDPVALLTAQRRLKKLVGEADATALTSGLTVDGDVLASLGPLVGLALLERGEIDAATYARRYGHRSPHEFEVSQPRPSEQPGWIEAQLASMHAGGVDALDLLAKQEAANRAAWERLVAAHPRRVRSSRKRLDRWARAERGREQARSELIRVFGVLRAYVVRAGELTGLGEEVFMLTIEEIVAVLDGGATPDTADRRAAFQRYAALPPYPSLIRGTFDPFTWAADAHRRSDVFDGAAEVGSAEGTVSGFPGASGIVEGTVRVLRSAEEGDQLRRGEILVTTVTNIGWTPMFPRAAAVVTDVGAPLSHAAIVARELGIPAVVGCGNATAVLHTGDRVRVDGSRGTVELLAEASG